MSRVLVLCAALALVGCEAMTHNDGNTVGIRHEHFGSGWEPHVQSLAAIACRDAGKKDAELVRHAPERPGTPMGLGRTISTYRCV